MLIQIIQNVKLHTETWITPFFILPHKVCLPLVSSVFTWSCKGMVLSCIKDKTLLGMAGFSLSNKKSVACIHYYKISFSRILPKLLNFDFNSTEMRSTTWKGIFPYSCSWSVSGMSAWRYSPACNWNSDNSLPFPAYSWSLSASALPL